MGGGWWRWAGMVAMRMDEGWMVGMGWDGGNEYKW